METEAETGAKEKEVISSFGTAFPKHFCKQKYLQNFWKKFYQKRFTEGACAAGHTGIRHPESALIPM
jgi:hypothetical protein